MASLGLGGLIDIQKLKFDVQLSVAKSGKFSGSITVRFLGGNPKTFGFYIQLRYVTTSLEVSSYLRMFNVNSNS